MKKYFHAFGGLLVILLLTNYNAFAQAPDSLSFSAVQFPDSTAARIFLGQPSDTVTLKIQNVLGTVIQHNEYYNWDAGTHEIYIGQSFPVGVYLVTVETSSDTMKYRTIFKTSTPLATITPKNAATIVNVWPNPTAQVIYLPQQTQSFRVIDLNGKEVLTGKNTPNAAVSVAHLPQGQYFIVLYNLAAKSVSKQAFIKE